MFVGHLFEVSSPLLGFAVAVIRESEHPHLESVRYTSRRPPHWSVVHISASPQKENSKCRPSFNGSATMMKREETRMNEARHQPIFGSGVNVFFQRSRQRPSGQSPFLEENTGEYSRASSSQFQIIRGTSC